MFFFSQSISGIRVVAVRGFQTCPFPIFRRNSTAHSLRFANDRGSKSSKFPAVGTGIAGFPLKECAEIMVREAAQHLRGETSLETVYFVLFDEAAQGVFERAWRKIQAEPAADSAGAKGA